jgi:tetratricopeptide (TPR) repeat protein
MKTNKIIKNLVRVLTIAVLFFCLYTGNAFAFMWDTDLPVPKYDPAWTEVQSMWEHHWDGKNINETITLVHKLEKNHPEKIEPYLWLAQLYLIKGQNQGKAGEQSLRQAEFYVAKAHEIDKNNVSALKLLVRIMPYIEDTSYTMSHYGQWIKSASPLPSGWAIPEMKGPAWEEAISTFGKSTSDISSGIKAADLFNKIADNNPKDGIAQVWASYMNFNIGSYYSSMDGNDKKAMPYYKKGIAYGDRAISLLPNSVPAHYWYQVNLASSIKNENLATKARYLNQLRKHAAFCMKENSSYDYFGPALVLSEMITNGGWVTAKGMSMYGINSDMILRSLELAEILYPDALFVKYARAELYAHKGKKKEAAKILEEIMQYKDNGNIYVAFGNQFTIKKARGLYNKIS